MSTLYSILIFIGLHIPAYYIYQYRRSFMYWKLTAVVATLASYFIAWAAIR